MLFSKNRRDGVYLKDLASFKKILPWVMPGINQSAVYYRLQLDLTDTLPLIQRCQQDGISLTLFQLLIAALLHTGVSFPELNRFVSSHRIYERREYSAAYTLKAGDGDATAKVKLSSNDSLRTISAKITGQTMKERQDAARNEKNIFDSLAQMPRWLMRIVMALWRFMDYYDLLPQAVHDLAPMYSSVYVANLGYYGIDAPFHHLFEYGNVPLFVTLGHVHQEHITTPDLKLELRHVVHLGITLDERIVSGSCSARALLRLKQLMEHPEELLDIPDSEASKRI